MKGERYREVLSGRYRSLDVRSFGEILLAGCGSDAGGGVTRVSTLAIKQVKSANGTDKSQRDTLRTSFILIAFLCSAALVAGIREVAGALSARGIYP